jgi:hypothetical protein
MSLDFLNAEREKIGGEIQTPCFARTEQEYRSILDLKPKYLSFYFPIQKTQINQILTKQYVNSIKELFDFGKDMKDIDFVKGTITFDLDVVSGHKIFAICTCIRLLEEEPNNVFSVWKELNNKKSFLPLTSMEKFVLMHYIMQKHHNQNHSLYAGMNSKCEEFISYKPKLMGRASLYSFSLSRTPAPEAAKLPFSQFPHFLKVSLFSSYSPEREATDQSFQKYIKDRTLSQAAIMRLKKWQPDL